MYLVDSNVWLQVLREREHAAEVREFLSRAPADRLSVSDFTLYSIGLVPQRYGQGDRYGPFLRQSIIEGKTRVVRADLQALVRLPDTCREFRLDFDDAYQYVAAEMHDLAIVSFDADFDRTKRGRMTPAQALASLADQT